MLISKIASFRLTIFLTLLVCQIGRELENEGKKKGKKLFIIEIILIIFELII